MTESTDFQPGDKVQLGSGTMQGTVVRVVSSKQFSNGGLPMVTVRWDSGAVSRRSCKALRKVNADV